MYSQRYGTPPLVHATGGLLDTVVDCTPATLADGSASGFLFTDMTASSFLDAILRVRAAYQNKPVWRSLMHNGMMKDFSWRASACGLSKRLSFAPGLIPPGIMPVTAINASCCCDR